MPLSGETFFPMEAHMDDQPTDPCLIPVGPLGFELKCHCCGCALPLLHPHIMVERYDENENIICECCYEKYRAAARERTAEE